MEIGINLYWFIGTVLIDIEDGKKGEYFLVYSFSQNKQKQVNLSSIFLYVFYTKRNNT